jgi:hypothetical protein
MINVDAGTAIQIIHQQDATVSQVYYLMFMCGSTCFGHLPTHHQEHTTALRVWFNHWRVAAGALLVVVCQTTTNNTPPAAVQCLNQTLSAVVCS